MLVPRLERIDPASVYDARTDDAVEVIESDSFMKFFVMVLTAVETVENAADPSRGTETTRV